MRWLVRHGDILDVPADVLICSANVYLTLSGGVGGAFLLRYGPDMQTALQQYLANRGVRHVEQGDVIEMPPCGSPYRAVLHAVAVDGFYASSPAIVADVVKASLRRAAELSARTIALAGLAMGYGRLSVADFAEGLRQAMGYTMPPVEDVVVSLRSRYDVEELQALLPELHGM
jgi:O-acetyl-ADP-ribose deacetylase (regulator of RNase III)